MTDFKNLNSENFNNGFLKNRLIKLALKILITVGVFYYISENIRFSEVFLQFKNSNHLLLFLVIILGFVNITFQYFKWKLSVKYLLNNSEPKKILFSLLQGFSAAIFTPARLGEYVGRAIQFTDKSFFQVVLATLIDKLFSILVVILLGSISTIIFIHTFYEAYILITISLIIVLSIFYYLIFLLLFNNNFWENMFFEKISKSVRLNKYFKKFEILKNLDNNFKIKMLILSLVFYLCILIQYAFLVVAFSNNYNLLEYLWVGNLIMFTKTIVPAYTFGELGIRESASIYFIQKIGENATVGFNASIFLFLINIVFPALLGLILNLRNNNE